MKTILMSIRPEWVAKIFNGEKTIEVRKTAPKPPFKVVVYCTKGDYLLYHYKEIKAIFCTYETYRAQIEKEGHTIFTSKVIGEFICDKTDKISIHNDIVYSVGNVFANKLKNMCLSLDELRKYLGDKNSGYALGITTPKLYDKPRELSEFYTQLPDKALDNGDYDCRLPGDMFCLEAPEGCDDCWKCVYGGLKAVTRPPQSWQYIVDPEEFHYDKT